MRFGELSSDGSVLRKYVDRVRTWDGNNLLTSSCFSCFCVYQKSPSPVDVGNGSSLRKEKNRVGLRLDGKHKS